MVADAVKKNIIGRTTHIFRLVWRIFVFARLSTPNKSSVYYPWHLGATHDDRVYTSEARGLFVEKNAFLSKKVAKTTVFDGAVPVGRSAYQKNTRNTYYKQF